MEPCFFHAIPSTSKNQYGRHPRDRKPSCSKDTVRNLVIKGVDAGQIVIVGRLTPSPHATTWSAFGVCYIREG